MFKIDMHIHSVLGGDSIIELAEVVPFARERGLDAVCITEHHSYSLSSPFDEITRQTGFPVFRGMEYKADEGHLLVYGVVLDRSDMIQQMPMQHVIDWVQQRGGVAVPAHPYQMPMRGTCLGDRVMSYNNVYAIEAINGSATKEENTAAVRAAESLQCGQVGGSDAHGPANIGKAYTVFPHPITTMAMLVAALKAGGYYAVYR